MLYSMNVQGKDGYNMIREWTNESHDPLIMACVIVYTLSNIGVTFTSRQDSRT